MPKLIIDKFMKEVINQISEGKEIILLDEDRTGSYKSSCAIEIQRAWLKHYKENKERHLNPTHKRIK